MASESDTSFASLLSGALNDIRDLFRREIALAKYEVRQEISKATTAAIAFAAAGIVLFFGTLFILTAIARGFAMLVAWPIWAGFGALGILLALVGVGLLVMARSRLRAVNVVPRQTAETLREDVQWLKQQTRSVRE